MILLPNLKLTTGCDSAKLRVLAIENKMNKIDLFNVSLTNLLISKMLDRQHLKKKNVLLFNFSESTSNSNESNEDVIQVKIVLQFLNIHAISTSVILLGSCLHTSIKPWPLKLCFSDQKDVFFIFASQNKLKSHQSWNNIRFSLN